MQATALPTKADIHQLKEEIQQLKIDFEKALHRQTWALVGVMLAQGAFIVAMLQLLQ